MTTHRMTIIRRNDFRIKIVRGTDQVISRNQIKVILTGMSGPPGADGPPGPSGGGYEYTQGSPATLWVINHNLGRYPVVDTYTVGGQMMDGAVLNTSVNQTQVSFSTAVAGTAELR